MSRRLTSPRGTTLDRGAEVRNQVRDALPGTYQEITQRLGLKRQLVEHAINQMIYRHEVEAIGEELPAKNGRVRKIWGLSRPPAPPSTDPWHNAWFRGSRTDQASV